MSYCSTVLAYAAPQISASQRGRSAQAKPETPNETPRLVQRQSALPRTSPVPTYSSATPSLDQRACIWIKQKCDAVERAVSRFSYDNACRETLLALDLALEGGHGHFSKGQLLNVEKCQQRRVAYLNRQTSENRTILKEEFDSRLVNRCKNDIKKLHIAMEELGEREPKLIKEGGFKHAAAICSALLKKLLALNASAKEFAEVEPGSKSP